MNFRFFGRAAAIAGVGLLSLRPALAAEPAPAPAVIPVDTPVLITIDEALSSKTSKEGDHFRLHLTESILLDGQVLAPEGATGEGEVIHVRRPGIGGKAGELIIAARYLDVSGVRVPIGHFRWGRAGRDNTDASLGVAIAAGVFGLFVTGGNIGVNPGTLANARTTAAASIPPVQPTTTTPQGAQP